MDRPPRLAFLTPTAESNVIGALHSGIVSANGTRKAILWIVAGPLSVARMKAFDAITLQQIYSSTDAGNRDLLPAAAHSKVKQVNGKVYVGTNSSLEVFGLL